MVRIAVRTLTLNIYKGKYQIRYFILLKKQKILFF